MPSNFNCLIKTVLDKSESKNWKDAVTEWEIEDCQEDCSCSTECICGKEGLRYLFTIHNIVNGNRLFPIGSSCIKKFGVAGLNEETSLWEKEFQLYDAVATSSFIDLKGGLFSRKLLKKLYDEGAFAPSDYNDHYPYKDYKFLLDMFNKREMTSGQSKRCAAIILSSIKPFILRKLRAKKIAKAQKHENQ